MSRAVQNLRFRLMPRARVAEVMSVSRSITASRTVLASLVAAAALIGFSGPTRAAAATPDPLATFTWPGFYTHVTDPSNDPPSVYFDRSAGQDRSDLARFVAQPRFRWFGAWVPLHDGIVKGHLHYGAFRTARTYIRTVTRGDRSKGAQIGIFRLTPFEGKAQTRRLPTRAEQRDYRRWINAFARGVRSMHTPTAIVLQPDLPLALTLPHHSKVDLNLIKWTAGVFARIPRSTVYLDAGSADWDKVRTMSRMLRRAGVARVRGFALNLTHYDSTAREVNYGHKIVRSLAHNGVRGKHFIVSTAMNGRGFTFQQHREVFYNMRVCRSLSDRACVTMGRLPTTETGDPLVDAYWWLSRSWYANATIRSYPEMLQIIRSSPYYSDLLASAAG